LKECSARDYFAAAEASLQGERFSQGLFCGGKSIPARRKVQPGIILQRQKHPCKEKSSARDYFAAAEASLQGEKFSQGLFCSGRSIPVRRKVQPGITLQRQKHLCKEKSSSRDYFAEAEASLRREKFIQRLFCGGKSISAKRNAQPGIILRRQKHLCREKSSIRDALTLKKASSTAPKALLR